MSLPIFSWSADNNTPNKRTPLYQTHLDLGARMIPFGGWEMPVWYSSVGKEHHAVRKAAGLFDVAHMGTLEVSGPYAADFMDLVGTNTLSTIKPGRSRYATLLDVDGHILDDMWVYRPRKELFFVVVNASNWEKDWAWLKAVNEAQVCIDREQPERRIAHPAVLKNLKSPDSGDDQRVDLALQGPNSLSILLACADPETDVGFIAAMSKMRRTRIVETRVQGIDLYVARTGYTGEAMGFELYVHPDRAVDLWQLLLARGADEGIEPCGLAARDSTRIEAGLPLYGHELAGPLNISQSEAGFDRYIKYEKPFFIGKAPYQAAQAERNREVIRFQISEKGTRAIRGGEHGEPVVNKRAKVIGTVTSCALVGDLQVGLALVNTRYTEPETELWLYPETRRAVRKLPQELEWGDTVALPIPAVILSRFPPRE